MGKDRPKGFLIEFNNNSFLVLLSHKSKDREEIKQRKMESSGPESELQGQSFGDSATELRDFVKGFTLLKIQN